MRVRCARLAAACAAAVALARVADARPPADTGVEVLSPDGRSWDEVLREVETDPATEGRTYGLTVRAHHSRVPCGEYELALDAAATKAFAVQGCDAASGETRLRVVDRRALFAPGDVVPRPLSVSVHAIVHQFGTAWGGGDAPTAGSKIWCSVWIQPYLWDGLRGAAVPLPPDRFELVPLDEHVHASPDGSGWIARGESHMEVLFHYEVRDRATGARVLENVATLACSDVPTSYLKVDPPSSDIPAWAYPPAHRTAAPSDIASWALPSPPTPPSDPRAHALSMDVRMIPAGAIFGASDVQQELVGVQLGMGKYISDRWYLGGAARWAALLDVSQGAMSSLLQVGPEFRYAFHLGRGSMRTNGGPSRAIPYVDWLGLRTGVEDIGPGTMGTFAEVSWGSEFRIGRADFGTVLAAGLGFDAPGAYGDDSIVHPYVEFAIRFGWNL